MLPTVDKFKPIELATLIVFEKLRLLHKLEPERAKAAYTILVDMVTTARFELLSAPSQVALIWRGIRTNEDVLDIVLKSVIHLKFVIDTPPTASEATPSNFDAMVKNLVESYSMFKDIAGPYEHSAIDVVLSERLCMEHDFMALVTQNTWLVVLMLLSMSPHVMEWKP